MPRKLRQRLRNLRSLSSYSIYTIYDLKPYEKIANARRDDDDDDDEYVDDKEELKIRIDAGSYKSSVWAKSTRCARHGKWAVASGKCQKNLGLSAKLYE